MFVLVLHFPAGGACKSTTTVNLASYLSLKFKTLVIDLDPQCTTTNALIEEIPAFTAYEVIRKQSPLEQAIIPGSKKYPGNLRVLAGSPLLSSFEVETALERNYWLTDQLEPVSHDFTLIDTSPSCGATTVMALTAATHVITPIACEPKCLEQLIAWERTLATIQKRINRNLIWIGILPCRYDIRNRLDNEVLNELQDKHPKLMLTPIRSSVRFRECLSQGLPPWKQPNDDYLITTNHILWRLKYEEEICPRDCITKTN